jgi:hypothetical protein
VRRLVNIYSDCNYKGFVLSIRDNEGKLLPLKETELNTQGAFNNYYSDYKEMLDKFKQIVDTYLLQKETKKKQILSLTFEEETFDLEVYSRKVTWVETIYNIVYTSETVRLQNYLSSKSNDWLGLRWSTNPIIWSTLDDRWFVTLSSSVHFQLCPTKTEFKEIVDEDE